MKNYLSFILLGCSLLILACSNDSGTTDEDLPTAVDKTGNLKASGDSANDILSNANFDKLLIEIAYVKDFRPTNSAITQFTQFLRTHTFKDEIELIYTELESPIEDELTLQEIANLESENRTAYNTDSTLAIYIYFADAPAEGDDIDTGLVTLGAVYRNTSMVIHEATVRNLAGRSPLIATSDVETATLNHEFGHLFGLVNLGTEPVNDHESQSENDEGILVGNNHCNQDGCLMRAELQFGGNTGKSTKENNEMRYEAGIHSSCILSGNTILNLLSTVTYKGGSAAVSLDSECILDIRSNGGR